MCLLKVSIIHFNIYLYPLPLLKKERRTVFLSSFQECTIRVPLLLAFFSKTDFLRHHVIGSKTVEVYQPLLNTFVEIKGELRTKLVLCFYSSYSKFSLLY